MVAAAPTTPLLLAPPTSTVVDYPVVLVLVGMVQYPTVMSKVKMLGDDLFPPGVYREVARAIITGNGLDRRDFRPVDRELLLLIWEEIATNSYLDTEEFALRRVGAQAERRFQYLLASLLRWAADECERGRRLAYLRRMVLNGFDIAEGMVPFDLAHTWEPTP
jgi:hypothetical protein